MKRQANALTAVLENWQDVEKAVDIYANSAGSAMRENEIYLDSWEAKSKSLSASWNELVNTFLNADMFKGFIDGATSVLKILTDINGMMPIFIGFLAGGLYRAIFSVIGVVRTFTTALAEAGTVAALSTGGLSLLIGVIVAVAGGLISWGISANDTAKQIEKLNTKIQEQQTEIDKLTAKEKDVVDLYKEYESLMSKSKAYGLNASEKENLLKISKELVDTYGLEVSGIDEVTGAYVVGANAINQYVEALRAERLEKEKEQTETRNKRIDKNINIAKESINPNDIEDYIQKAKKYYDMVQKDPEEWDNEFISQFQEFTRKYGLDKYMQEYLADGDIGSFTSALYNSAGKYTSAVGSVVKDLLTNIQVDNADMLDSNSESLLTQMLTPYLTTVDWDNFDQEEFEAKVKDFVDGSSQTLSNLATESKAISTRISSDGVAISNYKDLIENQTKQLGGIKEMFGENSEAAKEFQKNMENSAKSNIGMMFADISNDMKDAKLDTSKFDNLVTSILRLDKSMADGEITFSQYVGELNKQLDGVSVDDTFKGDTKAANEFFSVLTTKGKNAVQNLTAQMQKGAISQKDYIKGLSDIASYFVKLGDKAESLPGINPEAVTAINDYSSELDGLIKKFEKYSTLVEKMPTTWEDFKKSGQSGVKALIQSFKDAGVTAEDLGYAAGTSIDSIVTKMWDGKTDFNKVQDAMKTKFKATLKQMGVAIAKLINELTKQFGNVTFTVKAPEGGWWSALKKAVKGEDLSFGLGVETNIDQDAFADTIANAFGDLNFGGGFSTGGGTYTPVTPVDDDKGTKKNEALDNYLKHAENLYKIHQNEEKYINDLQWGYNNLTKTLKEQLDIIGKIDEANRKLTENQIKDIEHQIDLKKKLYGEDVDVINELNDIQKKAHEGADDYRAYARTQLGYDNKTDEEKSVIDEMIENTDEIQGFQKTWWDAQNSKLDFYNKQHENILRDIEHTRDMALEANPFADTTSYYKQMQDEYHKEAERLRALDPEKYKEEIQELQMAWHDAQNAIVDWRWEDSQNWIEQRNAYNDWELFGDSEMQAWERVVKWLKEEYPNELDKIREAEQSLFEARKEEFNKANDFANSYLDSQKTILQAQFDVENSIAEARHEINKELETSMTMYGYLKEETRQLLFNQEDYNKLSRELNDIEDEALRLQSEYEEKLNNSTLETVESITSQYEMQYETLMKSYEIAKADLEIAKKKAKLNNVLNERNVRMFINGQWQWVANTEDVINAKSELADAEYAKRVEESGLTQQESINNLTKQQDELGVVVKKFENGVIDLGEAIYLAEQAIGNMPSALASIFNNAKGTSSGSSRGSSSGGVNYSLSQINSMSPEERSKAWHGANEESKYYLHEANKRDLGGSNTYDSATGIWKKKEYATGTRYTDSGLALMGEDGFEAFISSNGHLIPINQPTIGNIASGGVVFNTDQMKNLRSLWDMSNLNLNADRSYISKQSQQAAQTIDNRIIINGMTVDSGSSDGQALISALRRYVGNH